MKRSALLFALLVVLAGCGPGEATSAPEPTATSAVAPSPTATATPTATAAATSVPVSTATPTPTPVLIAGASATPEALPPGDGWLEIRIVDPMAGDEDCLAQIPFTVTPDGARFMVDGGGPVDCEFVNTMEIVVHHHIYDLDTTLAGEVLTGLATAPGAQLQAELWLEGEMRQFYTDVPPEVDMIFTEDAPFVAPPQTDPLMLVMPYVEGATVYLTKDGMVGDLGGAVPAWTIILHLGP